MYCSFALERIGRKTSDRTCRAWAAGDSLPPVGIVLILLHDSQVGEALHEYVMRDCTAPWWRDIRRARRIVAQLDQIDFT